MTAVLSVVLASGLVVIIALDHPFSGPVLRRSSNTCLPMRNVDSAKCDFEGAIGRKGQNSLENASKYS
jgi:hypothetical protein